MNEDEGDQPEEESPDPEIEFEIIELGQNGFLFTAADLSDWQVRFRLELILYVAAAPAYVWN